MDITITVKDINGSPIQGVEVTYRRPNNLFAVDTQITNANGIVTIKHDTWTNGWYYTFKKSTEVCPFKLAYEDFAILPMKYNVVLSPAILCFKLYKYNEDTKTEELYKQSIKIEPYRYSNGYMTAETVISSLSRDDDGYYYIDLRDHSVSHLIEYTSFYLFKITANNLTDYGSIFLLPNDFIEKQVTEWDALPFKINILPGGNTLPNQTMVFYPKTKRLTKAELRKCVVSNPHLMEDGKNDTYCPTNLTYSTIYNMIKDSNNRDNNYISGAEDINFYQNKTLTIVNSANNACDIKYYINAPGRIRGSTSIAPGASNAHNIYYSANAQVKAVSGDNNYVVSPGLQTITMDDNKTITFTCKERTFTYIIEKISLLGLDSGSGFAWKRARIFGKWKDETPSTVDDLSIAVTIYDPVNKGYLSFKDTFEQCTGTGTDKLAHRYMYESIDRGQNTDKDIVWENGKSFYVVSIFFSNPNIYYQFKNNGYYSSGVFRPHVVPEPTNAPQNPDSGSSWGGGDYTVTVIPNGKSVECDLEDNRGNKKHETITSDKTYKVQSLTVTGYGYGYWNYSSDSGITDGPDADVYIIPVTKDPTGRKIKLELEQPW